MRPVIAITSLLVLTLGVLTSCAGDRYDRESTAYRDGEEETVREREIGPPGAGPAPSQGRWAPHPSGIGPGSGR